MTSYAMFLKAFLMLTTNRPMLLSSFNRFKCIVHIALGREGRLWGGVGWVWVGMCNVMGQGGGDVSSKSQHMDIFQINSNYTRFDI